MSITLYIGRHGETKLNSEEKLRGWVDIPLNDEGVREAHKMAGQMKNIPIDKIYSSDLDRAMETAEIIAKAHKMKVVYKSWFRPLNYGDLNGKLVSEIQDQLDKLTQTWKTDPSAEAPNGESFEEFQERNLDGLDTIMGKAKDGQIVVLVAHLRNALLFRGVADEGGPLQGDAVDWMKDDHKGFHQASGEIAKYEWNGKLNYVGMVK